MGKQKKSKGPKLGNSDSRRVQGLAEDIIESGVVKSSGRKKIRLRNEADDEVNR